MKMLERDGWRLVKGRGKGSHRVYKHPEKPGSLIVPGHPSDEIRPKTLKNILRGAGLKGEEK